MADRGHWCHWTAVPIREADLPSPRGIRKERPTGITTGAWENILKELSGLDFQQHDPAMWHDLNRDGEPSRSRATRARVVSVGPREEKDPGEVGEAGSTKGGGGREKLQWRCNSLRSEPPVARLIAWERPVRKGANALQESGSGKGRCDIHGAQGLQLAHMVQPDGDGCTTLLRAIRRLTGPGRRASRARTGGRRERCRVGSRE